MYFNFFNMLEGDFGKKYTKSRFLNDTEFFITFFNNLNIALDRFKWGGLPSTCNERFLELQFLCRGQACLYKDDVLGYVNPICGIGGGLNLYGEPSTITLATSGSDLAALHISGKLVPCYMEGSDNRNVKAVWARDNYMGLPYIYSILAYSERMADVMRSITVAAKTMKIPWILTCPPEVRESLLKTIEKIDDNELAIVGVDFSQINRSELFTTGANPAALKALWEHYRNLENELRTLLGIENQENTDKKERLLVDEVNSNNEAIEINASIPLNARKRFCENISKVFPDLSITVGLRHKRKEVINGEDGRKPGDPPDASRNVD